MPEAEGALVAPLDEIHGPWAEFWGWLPVAGTGEDAKTAPLAEGDAEGEVAEGPSALPDSSTDLLPVVASEDVFRCDFAGADGAADQGAPAATEGRTLDQIDIAALIAGGKHASFLVDWNFGVVTVQVQASEGTPPEDEGPGFEVVLSAVGDPEVNAAWL